MEAVILLLGLAAILLVVKLYVAYCHERDRAKVFEQQLTKK